jgi:ParB-like chromosome segregation protein Spo0J
MKIKMVAIGQVVPYERNPRNNQAAVDGVAASIEEFGWQQPIVVDSDMVIIVGHTRLLAAQKLGLEKVPVHIATELTPAQVKAYRLADNKTGEAADWDEELLKLELEDLKLDNFNLELTGFDSVEIQKIVQAVTTLPPDPDPPKKQSPALPSEAKANALQCEPGDVLVFGNHELMVGYEEKPILAKILRFIHKEWPDLEIERNGSVIEFEG